MAGENGAARLTGEVGGTNIATLLTRMARARPDGFALGDETGDITWRELERRVDLAVGSLRRSGARVGDRVVVWLSDSVSLIVLMWAIWRVGSSFAGFGRFDDVDRVIEGTDQLRARLVVTNEAGVRSIRTVRCMRNLRTQIEAVENIAGAVPLMTVPEATDDKATLGDAVLPVNAECWCFSTGGTTGSPKFAAATHDQMAFVVANFLADVVTDLTPVDRCLVLTPLSHAAGVHHLLHVARGAGTVVLQKDLVGFNRLHETIAEYGVTNFFVVPTLLRRMVSYWSSKPEALRLIVHAGEPMPDSLREACTGLFGDILVEYYGLVEVPGCIASRLRGAPYGMAGVGPVRTGMQVAIDVNGPGYSDGGRRRAPDLTHGEILVRGPAVFSGYVGRPADERFVDGWFKTGDRGFVDDSGNLHVLGRLGDEFISGGVTMFPQVIEQLATTNGAVSEAVVFGVPSSVWGEECVMVAVAPGRTVGDVQRSLRLHLPAQMVPKHVELRDRLPMGAVTKVARKEVRLEWINRHRRS